MLSKRSREGELLIDHRASPGLPENFMQNLGFIDAPDTPEGKMWLGATLTCAHCNSVVIKKEDRTRERGHCFKCNAYICDGCVATAALTVEHTSFEKILDQVEQRAYRAQQNELTTRFNLK